MGEVCRNVDHLIAMRPMPIGQALPGICILQMHFLLEPPFFVCNETESKQINETS